MDTFLQDWLNATPTAVYANWANLLNATPTQQKYYQNNYSDVYNKYQGKLANMATQGMTPTLTFQDYLSSYPWLKEFQNLGSYYTGWNPQSYSPRFRWLVY